MVASDESRDVKGAPVPLVIQASAEMTREAVGPWVEANQPVIEDLLKVPFFLVARTYDSHTHR